MMPRKPKWSPASLTEPQEEENMPQEAKMSSQEAHMEPRRPKGAPGGLLGLLASWGLGRRTTQPPQPLTGGAPLCPRRPK